MEEINGDELKFKLPTGMIISGPSNSGKTQFLLKLWQTFDEMFTPRPEAILYCYGEYISYIPQLESQGIPSVFGSST